MLAGSIHIIIYFDFFLNNHSSSHLPRYISQVSPKKQNQTYTYSSAETEISRTQRENIEGYTFENIYSYLEREWERVGGGEREVGTIVRAGNSEIHRADQNAGISRIFILQS